MTVSPNRWRDAAAPDAEVLCHWMTWGKLLQDPLAGQGVVAGLDHGVTRMSEDFPEDLVTGCTLPALLGVATSVASVLQETALRSGAFIYRQVCCGSGCYAVFSRVQSLPENGAGIGRQHDQLTVLAVDIAQWSPALIGVLHAALFEEQYAARDSAVDRRRMGCPRPSFRVVAGRPGYPVQDGKGEISVIDGPALAVYSASPRQQVATVAGLLAGSALRWSVVAALPWSLGLAASVRGPDGGFAIRSVHGLAAAAQSAPRPRLDRVIPLSRWLALATKGECKQLSDGAKSGSSQILSSLERFVEGMPPACAHDRISPVEFLLAVTNWGNMLVSCKADAEVFAALRDLPLSAEAVFALAAEVALVLDQLSLNTDWREVRLTSPMTGLALDFWDYLLAQSSLRIPDFSMRQTEPATSELAGRDPHTMG